MTISLSGSVVTVANEATKSINAVSSIAGGIRLLVPAHGYSVGDAVLVTGTTSYNGPWLVSATISADMIDITGQSYDGAGVNPLVFVSSQAGNIARGEKNPAGLSAIAGVTTWSSGGTHPITVYNMGSLQLNLTGLLWIPMGHTILWGGALSTTNGRYYHNGGTLVIDKRMRRFGGQSFRKEDALVFTGVGGSSWNNPPTCYLNLASGIFKQFGGRVVHPGALRVQDTMSLVQLRSAIWDGDMTAVTDNDVPVWYMTSGLDKWDVIGWDMVRGKFEFAAANTSAINFKGVSVIASNRAFSTGAQLPDGTWFDVFGLRTVDSTCGMSLHTRKRLRGINSDRFPVILNDVVGGTGGLVEQRHRVGFTLTDTAGVAQPGSRVYCADNNSGTRRNWTETLPNETYTADRTYSATADGAGKCTLDLLTFVNQIIGPNILTQWFTDNRFTGDVAQIKAVGYKTLVTDLTHSTLKGTAKDESRGVEQGDNFAYTVAMLADTSVTEANSATVAAYTTIDTAAKLYDRLKLWLVENFAGQANPFSRIDANVNLGSYNITVDATAAAAFALSGSDIIIKATAFTGSLTTTGTVTLANGATVSAGYKDTTGVRVTVSGLEPEGFGTTWVLGWVSQANYDAANLATPPASWTGFNQASGTGNSTALTLAPSTTYQLFIRTPGYRNFMGPVASINTSLQSTITISQQADTDVLGSKLWTQSAAHAATTALITYNFGAQIVEFSSVGSGTLYVPFLAAYRALETLAKQPLLAYQMIQPLYVNGTKDGFSMPRNNPLYARVTAASTRPVILEADVRYDDTNKSALDRFVANAGNAGGHLVYVQATAAAELSSTALTAVRSGLALTTDVTAVPAAVRTNLTTELGRIDAAISTRLAAASYTAPANADIAAVKAKTDNLPTQPAAVGSEMTLTSAYEAAKTAASQSSVNAIPTNPLLASGYTAPDNAGIAAINGRLPEQPAAVGDQMALTVPAHSDLVDDVSAATRIDLERTGGMLDGVRANASRIPEDPATIGEYNLALGAIATAIAGKASQSSINALPSAAANAAAVWAAAARTLTANPGASASDIAAAVRTNLATELARLDVAVGTRATPGAAMTLTSGERATLAAAIEAALLNDGDGQALVQALVNAIGSSNVDQAAFVAAVQVAIERTGGMLHSALTNTERIPALPAAAGEYNSALATLGSTLSAKASQSSVDALPTANAIATQAVLASTFASLETQSSAANRAAAQQAEHDATQAAIAAIPTQVRTQVDAALVAYDALVPSDISTLATESQVNSARDVVLSNLSSIKAKTDKIPEQPATKDDITELNESENLRYIEIKGAINDANDLIAAGL